MNFGVIYMVVFLDQEEKIVKKKMVICVKESKFVYLQASLFLCFFIKKNYNNKQDGRRTKVERKTKNE